LKRGSFQPTGSAYPVSARNAAYARRVTGVLAIENASSQTRCRGLSHRNRFSEPIQNQPSGIKTMLKIVPSIDEIKGCIQNAFELLCSDKK
jgi:hypothetical protein